MANDTGETSIKDLGQLEAVYGTLVNCGCTISSKSDDLAILQNELSRVWEDGKGEEFKEVIYSLIHLNEEAMEQLKSECLKLSNYIDDLRGALGVEVRQ